MCPHCGSEGSLEPVDAHLWEGETFMVVACHSCARSWRVLKPKPLPPLAHPETKRVD